MSKTIIKQVLQFSDGSVVELVPPTPVAPRMGLYAYCLQDYESMDFFREDWGYSVPRSLLDDKDKLNNMLGYPSMVPLKPRIGVKLTKELQWFWVKQLVLSAYGIELIESNSVTFEQEFNRRLLPTQQIYIKEAWRGLTRDNTAFTNGRGTNSVSGGEECRDYIRGLNLSAEYPMLWENTCSGNTLRVNSKTVPADAEWVEVRTLKTSEYGIWRNWNFRTHPELFTLATNSTPYLVGTRDTWTKTGPWKVDPMHFLGGKDVPVPLISAAGYVYVLRSRVRILVDPVRFPSVYNA